MLTYGHYDIDVTYPIKKYLFLFFKIIIFEGNISLTL
ncbi:MAG: hypothetical protein JWQ85_1355 [Mucilaginibacter sp.]|jgi:hypothetical protein|nr:hypothetical protein [Mucilaginibacter sp.]